MANLFHTLAVKISTLIAGIMLAFTGGTAYHAPQPHAQTASAVVVTEQTTSSAPSQASSPATSTIQSTNATADTVQPLIERVEYNPLASANFVTQASLKTQLQQLTNTLTAKLTPATGSSVSQNTGTDVQAQINALQHEIAQTNQINNLSNVTIANPTISGLSASAIPDLSGSYLSLNGGTLAGAFTDSSNASSSFVGALGIGTTSPSDTLAVNGPVFLASASPASTADRLYNNAGSLYWAGSPIAGASVGNWMTDGTNAWRTSGDVGIGTSSPSQALSVQGNALFSGNISASSGTTSLQNLDLSGNILSTLSTASAPSSLGNWNSINTAFTGDLSHLGLGLSHSTTGTSLGTPSSGYLITRELASIASYDYNSSGYNADTGDNGGRTGALNIYAKNDNYGQGDSTSFFCDGFVDQTRSGATSFLAEPEAGCIGGQLFAGANGDLLEGVGDINFKDQGNDASVVGLNFNFDRTNATGNLNANWGAWTFQNQGTLPIDWMLRASGAVRTGLDLSALTFPDYTLVSISLGSGGSGYSVGDQLTPPDGTYSQQTVIKVLTVNGSGTILTFGIDRAGLYTVVPASPSTVSGGTGSGATFVLQYSTGGNPALITPANDCWYGNAAQDTSVYDTSYSSTLKLGTSWICYSSSLGAWNFISGNQSILQLYSNQAIVNTNFRVVGNAGIGTTSPATTFAVSGSGYVTAGLGIGVLNTATGTLQTTGTTTIGGLSTLQSGFVSQASSTVVGNFTSTGNGIFAGTLALNSTTGTSTIASGQGFTIGSSQFVVQQSSGYVGIGSASPTSPLFVSTALHGLNELAFVNGNNGNNLAGLYVDGSSNAWWRLYNSSNVETVRFNSAGTSYIDGGNVGIGTSTPYSRFEVWGPDTASTTAFAVVNNASTTVFAVYDSGNSTYSGSIFQSSDQRLKTDITPLDSSSSLSAIEALNPVSYLRLDQPGTGENLGFIAQQVQTVFPQLVSTTSPTALTPDGTLTLNYNGLISPIVAAIQALASEITSLEDTVAGFAQSITSAVGNFGQVNTSELCLTDSSGSTCYTRSQLNAALASSGQQSNSSNANNSGNNDSSATNTPPVIQINGDNPAIIQVGATYNDLGATITGPQADLNLGIQTYVNGSLMSPVQIDTSQAATDTIDYVATDQNGLTSTSTRTVIIEAPQTETASSTDQTATSTSQ